MQEVWSQLRDRPVVLGRPPDEMSAVQGCVAQGLRQRRHNVQRIGLLQDRLEGFIERNVVVDEERLFNGVFGFFIGLEQVIGLLE
jgi:hypothetical protein